MTGLYGQFTYNTVNRLGGRCFETRHVMNLQFQFFPTPTSNTSTSRGQRLRLGRRRERPRRQQLPPPVAC